MKQTILIVDDEPSIRDLLNSVFAQEGYETVQAENAEEALNVLKDEMVLICFLDLFLPGLNGIELCRKIREWNPFACCYAMTGHTSVFELAECREAGFEDYFTKPLDIKLLVKAAESASAKIERWNKREGKAD